MPLSNETELSPKETDEFLGRHETGVLSLARGDDPYSIPISYGYNADTRCFYLRLVSTPESEKRSFLSSNPRARLVVYEEDDPTYVSVIVTGSLQRIPREDLTIERVEQYGEAKRPLFEIWSESRREVDVELYEMNPEDMSGRHIEVERNPDST